ncbi:hypothetical protein ACJIZ3_022618 [Penstemon smallii]|uniref:Growth-regulating factor n=1 Tax=Penstemon smallii TaxID=265156 RepID=A0ABD3TNT6_9LAMI
MEKETTNISTSDAFSFSDKKSSSPPSPSSNTTTTTTASDALITSMKLQPTKTTIHHLDRRFGPTDDCTAGGATDVLLGNIYRDNNNGGENFGKKSTPTLQPFPHFTCSYPPTTHFKSPEGGMATSSMGFAFTSAQWKELERQAMIYKFMISSVPVPPHLLSPADSSTIYNGKYSKNGDPEPGRCKRTDGKKWRCSRDVAPNQKYCERHLHRGRPRSRKPVEVKKTVVESQKKRQQLEQQNPVVLPHCSATTEEQPLLSFNHKTDLSISTSPSSYKGTNRDLGCEMIEQQWKHLVEPNMGSSIYASSASYFPNIEQQPLNLFSYSPFSAQEYEPPNGFIDAWSIENLKYNTTNSNNGNSDSCISLNLSMAMGAENELESDVKGCNNNDKTKDLRCPVSWEPFAGGGPLAEALHPGSVPASPYDSISSNQATTVSSPSGVLHRTLFSHSDNSVCNSPTALASEVAFHWLN